MTYDPKKIKRDFPIFHRRVNGAPLTYCDNASTTQKPQAVLDSLERYWTTMNANIHRGVHTLSEEATEAYEQARRDVAAFIGAEPEEIVFTRNTTEAINLVARTWGMQNIKRGDTIVTTEMEHHSNLLPWHWLAHEKKAKLEIIPITDDGQLDIKKLPITKYQLLTVSHMSNVLGTINPVEKIASWAHEHDALVLVDGAQSVAHMPVDVKKLGCDFFVFSGHKMGGPTGIGVLWARRELLESMEPFLYGGDMVKSVRVMPYKLEARSYQLSTVWNDTPYKFEAGTPDIAGAIGLGAAVRYLRKVGMKNIQRHEQELTAYALKKLSEIPGLTVLGPRDAKKRGSAVAFTLTGIHPHDLATILDRDGVAIRSGHHCAMPLHQRFGLDATARASFWIYNTTKDVDALVKGITKAQRIFQTSSKLQVGKL